MIETVAGAIAPEELGPTLMHEHIFVLNRELEANYPGRWDEDERIRDAAARWSFATASRMRSSSSQRPG